MTAAIHSPAIAIDSQRLNLTSLREAKPGQIATIDRPESKRLDEAARQFEAVFLRQMLSSLERTLSTKEGKEAGSNLYGSMMVDAVADAVSRAGGIGLASMLTRSLEPQLSHPTTVQSASMMASTAAEPQSPLGSAEPSGTARGGPS
jgi:peptidoglycan hydrolase FlgJ